jgi:hypothetical protein
MNNAMAPHSSEDITSDEPLIHQHCDFFIETGSFHVGFDTGADDSQLVSVICPETMSCLAVTLKTNEMEDELLEDEAIDTSTPGNAALAEEDGSNAMHREFGYRESNNSHPKDRGLKTGEKNSDKLTKSDSGYSSISSKTLSQPPPVPSCSGAVDTSRHGSPFVADDNMPECSGSTVASSQKRGSCVLSKDSRPQGPSAAQTRSYRPVQNNAPRKTIDYTVHISILKSAVP